MCAGFMSDGIILDKAAIPEMVADKIVGHDLKYEIEYGTSRTKHIDTSLKAK